MKFVIPKVIPVKISWVHVKSGKQYTHTASKAHSNLRLQMLLIMWKLSGKMHLSMQSSLITFCPLLGLQGVSTVAGEEHFTNRPCAERCGQPGHFGVKMAVKPKLVSVRGSTGKQTATESKTDRFLTVWKRKMHFHI